MATTVSAEQLVFENAAGERTIIKLSSLAGSGPQPKDRQGLLLWGIFYQLVELNQRLGVWNNEARTGTAISGLLAQSAASNIETSEKLGKLVELMEGLATQAATAQANAPSPQAMMTQAMQMMREMGMETPPGGFPVPGASGGNGSGT